MKDLNKDYKNLMIKNKIIHIIKKKFFNVGFNLERNTQKKDINYNWQHYDTKNIIEKTSPIIKFTSPEIDFAHKILEKKEILKKDKIILLVVRDPAYYDHIFSNKTSIF